MEKIKIFTLIMIKAHQCLDSREPIEIMQDFYWAYPEKASQSAFVSGNDPTNAVAKHYFARFYKYFLALSHRVAPTISV